MSETDAPSGNNASPLSPQFQVPLHNLAYLNPKRPLPLPGWHSQFKDCPLGSALPPRRHSVRFPRLAPVPGEIVAP